MIALEKLLQREGFGSRRECRRLIAGGQVSIDGTRCDDPELPVDDDGFAFAVAGVDWIGRRRALLMLNKPAGTECSRSPTHHPSVLSLLPPQLVRRGVQPVGRLDADTTGLLLLTDDGVLNHRLTSPRHGVDKTYQVELRHPVADDWAARLCAGLTLRDSPEPVAARAARLLAPTVVELTIGEGRYHQVKRMVAAAGNRVETLRRVAVGGLALPGDLETGAWRWLGDDDLAQLLGDAAGR